MTPLLPLFRGPYGPLTGAGFLATEGTERALHRAQVLVIAIKIGCLASWNDGAGSRLVTAASAAMIGPRRR